MVSGPVLVPVPVDLPATAPLLTATTIVEKLAGTVVVVGISAGAGRSTGTGTRTGPETTDLICSLALVILPSGFL